MLQDPLLLLTLGLKTAIAGILLLAAARDIMTRIVPNWMPLTLAILCTALAFADFHPFWGAGFGIAIFAFCFLAWRFGCMGGADVKLLGAAAIAISPSDAETFLLAVPLFGGVLALAYLVGRYTVPKPGAQRPATLLPRVIRIEAWRIRHRAPMPYACAIAAGTLFVLN